MKITLFKRGACVFLLTFLLSHTLFSQQEAEYPFEINEITVNVYNSDGIWLLSAEVLGYDYFILKLRKGGDPEIQIEMPVRPFTQENFTRTLRKMFNSSDAPPEDLHKFNSSKNENSDEEEDNYDKQNFIGENNDAITQHEIALFYLLKGAEVNHESSDELPVAGELCLNTKNIQVTQSKSDFRNVIFGGEEEMFFKEKYSEYIDSVSKFNIKMIRYKKFKRKYKESFSQEYDLFLENRFDFRQSQFYQEKNDLGKEIETTLVDRNALIDSLNTLTGKLRVLFYLNKDSIPNYKINYNKTVQIRPGLTAVSLRFTKPDFEKISGIDSIGDCLQQIDTMLIALVKNQKVLRKHEDKMNRINDAYIYHFQESSKIRAFDVSFAQFEFNEGFIENIEITGKLSQPGYEVTSEFTYGDFENENTGGGPVSTIKFESEYPIGFSRKRDYRNLYNIKLKSYGVGVDNKYEMKLGDLIENYYPKLVNGRRDYSPSNFTLYFDPNSQESCVKLYKESTSKLFEAKVYSDFVGLDEKNNNGLIQTEISKKLNLNTKRIKRNFGIGAWIEPIATFSKIEQHNRNLKLDQAAPPENGHNRFYAATLPVKQHEMFNVGFNGNLVYADLIMFKTIVSYNSGVNFGRTPVETDTAISGVNTFTWFSEVDINTRADERWGIGINYRWSRMNILDRNIAQVADIQSVNEEQDQFSPKLFNTFQIQLNYQPGQDNRGKLFFRYRYHHFITDFNLGFHQAQIGYSFYIVNSIKSEKKK